MTYRSLTQTQVIELLEDYEGGWTVNDCSVIYRISVRTVYRVLADYNVPRQDRNYYSERRVKSRKRKKKPPLKPCGTNAAYQRHRKAKELPCPPCLAAHAANVAEAKAKKK